MEILDYITVPNSVDSPEFLIIGLHGRDGNKHSLEVIAHALRLPNTAWVLPSAPFFSNRAEDARVWFPLDGNENEEQFRAEAQDMLFTLLEHFHNDGIPFQRMFLLGFSQGASMAIDTALRFHEPAAGLIPLSGFVNNPRDLALHHNPDACRIPAFVGHGLHDRLLPPLVGYETVEFLRGLGCHVEAHFYNTGHRITSHEIRDIRSFVLRYMRETDHV